MEKLNLVTVTEHPANENEQIAFIQIPQGPCFDLCCIEGESMTREEFTKWATFFASCPELLEENERLKEWKRQEIEVWKDVIAFGQSSESGLNAGDSISRHALKSMKAFAALTEENAKLKEERETRGGLYLQSETDNLRLTEDNKRLREALEKCKYVFETLKKNAIIDTKPSIVEIEAVLNRD